MKIELSFPELNTLVKNATGKSITIRYQDSRTVRVLYSTKVMFVNKDFDIRLRINNISGKSVSLTFSSDGFAVETLIKMALYGSLNSAVYSRNGNTVTLYLDRLPGLYLILMSMKITSFLMNENGILIQLQKE